jgi:hypothetical protein
MEVHKLLTSLGACMAVLLIAYKNSTNKYPHFGLIMHGIFATNKLLSALRIGACI